MMKIDLHVHSAERSPCARSGEEEQIRAAIACGLDALVMTDHARFIPQMNLDFLNRKYAPFRILSGIEITVQEREDVLVLGVHDPDLEISGWTYAELHALVRRHRGWLAIAHPFRYRATMDVDLERYPPDALEVCSMNVPREERQRIGEIAAGLGIQVVCNSDSHIVHTMGVAYNVLHKTPADEAELVQLLRNGAFECVCMLTP
jgi:histidinol phosphatase-like PHP family hydrolase